MLENKLKMKEVLNNILLNGIIDEMGINLLDMAKQFTVSEITCIFLKLDCDEGINVEKLLTRNSINTSTNKKIEY